MPFLDWVNKNQARASSTQVPYHLLQKEAEYGAPSENMVIQGDNLLALRALMPLYAGRVKCIFIDPPYNTQSAFEHYDDKLEHSQWLSMMYPRLVLLRDLLSENGSIWITIDDNESHYLKVLMDEVFGRKNFIANIVWQKKYAVKSDSEFLSESHDHILIYAKSKIKINLNRLPRTDSQDARYKNQDNDPRGPWTSGPLQRNEARDYAIYPIFSPTGKEHWPPKGTSWRYTKDKLSELISENRIWFGATGNNVPRLKRFLNEVSDTIPATTWWDYAESGHNDEARREAKLLQDDDNLFSTPKPERILKKIITMGSNPGDLVLDSFLGSGTTAAVAHKMGRRYIGIEMGEHAKTHCIPRLQKVIEGEQGGISQSVEWQGGGGFGFYTLHPEPVFQANGQIRPDIKFEPLAAYIWHMETGVGSSQTMDSPLLGVYNGIAYYLLYNGILGDRRPQGGNVLTRPILAWLQAEYPHDGPKVIYGESIRIGEERLAQANVTFKQIPYDVILR
ncbi:site-specific DNA-methyltransferase [Aeromonas jandaei]|uniref:site-specific DNA-methyltransferase n=1 Tax=Aeromonas jandaei TaxID=650 RepID=UPI0011169923|nr:site-specific DNA-methyltransferase [Aeromonas jandaei]MCF7716129.1 site-specific DNA-methyltransferase [Aeromonas jandaei]TNH98362.1 site-specific DNA-methyltransferase [Aeromonas jandaei]